MTVASLIPTTLTRAEISQLNETKNKHVADGLAWSYYFGYLKFTLPRLNETISRAIKDDFVIEGEDLRDRLSSRKVFIVVPRNGFSNSDFENNPKIKQMSCMPSLKHSRAGVKEREYKFTCYKITAVQNDTKFAQLEYATPCLSMWEMSKHEASKFTEEDLEIQIKEFVVKLRQILESDPHCAGRYELLLTGPNSSCKNNNDSVAVALSPMNRQDYLADLIYRSIVNDS